MRALQGLQQTLRRPFFERHTIKFSPDIRPLFVLEFQKTSNVQSLTINYVTAYLSIMDGLMFWNSGLSLR